MFYILKVWLMVWSRGHRSHVRWYQPSKSWSELTKHYAHGLYVHTMFENLKTTSVFLFCASIF
jgi:hypothetical protein